MISEKEYTPVLICVYNRPIHFQQCVESLKLNLLAKQTHLYVAIDAAYRDQDKQAISEVVAYAKTITGFKDVTLFIREKNYGRNNIFFARNEIFQKYDRLIFMEDDNVVSTDFLDFMNQGLDAYTDRKDIFSVCGYNVPVEMPSSYTEDVYLWRGYSAWGVGIWKDKWNSIQWEPEDGLRNVRSFLKKYSKVFRLNKISNHYLSALVFMLKLNKLSGDGYVSMYQFINGMCSVFPVVSRVRNTGHDGSGVNCESMEDDFYSYQKIYEGDGGKYKMPKDLREDRGINKVIYKHFEVSSYALAKTTLKLILTNFGLINKAKNN